MSHAGTPNLPPSVAGSPLFKLPAKRRNETYELAMQRIRIHVRANGFLVPGLLHTCHIVRAEAHPIFFCTNQFAIKITNLKCTALLLWEQRLCRRYPDYKLLESTIVRPYKARNWPNLLDWLERFHARDLELSLGGWLTNPPGAGSTGTQEVEARVVGGAFHIMRGLRRAKWKYVKQLLEAQYHVLVACDQRWALSNP